MRASENQGLAAGALLAIGTLLLTFYFAPWRGTLAPGKLPPELAGEPDLYMERAGITQFQDDGSIGYRLAVREARHFEGQGFTQLLEPDLELHNATEPPWRITSKRGEIQATASGEQVRLRDSVLVRHEDSGSGHMTIRCEALDIYPERKYAETEGDVMIDTDVGRTAARGLQADLARGTMRLSFGTDAAVHTIVEPEQFRSASPTTLRDRW